MNQNKNDISELEVGFQQNMNGVGVYDCILPWSYVWGGICCENVFLLHSRIRF